MTFNPSVRRSRPSLAGTIGGMVGGLAFAIIMYAAGMFPTVGRLVGDQSFTTGLIVHIVISLVFGALYGLLVAWRLSGWLSAAVFGLLYGVFWWILGGNILLPLLLGFPVSLGGFASKISMISLGGHLLYGVLTGVITHAVSELDG